MIMMFISSSITNTANLGWFRKRVPAPNPAKNPEIRRAAAFPGSRNAPPKTQKMAKMGVKKHQSWPIFPPILQKIFEKRFFTRLQFFKSLKIDCPILRPTKNFFVWHILKSDATSMSDVRIMELRKQIHKVLQKSGVIAYGKRYAWTASVRHLTRLVGRSVLWACKWS